MRRFFFIFAVKFQVSDEYVTTGLIIVHYIFILVFTIILSLPYLTAFTLTKKC
jgi:hypothetical protein